MAHIWHWVGMVLLVPIGLIVACFVMALLIVLFSDGEAAKVFERERFTLSQAATNSLVLGAMGIIGLALIFSIAGFLYYIMGLPGWICLIIGLVCFFALGILYEARSPQPPITQYTYGTAATTERDVIQSLYEDLTRKEAFSDTFRGQALVPKFVALWRPPVQEDGTERAQRKALIYDPAARTLLHSVWNDDTDSVDCVLISLDNVTEAAFKAVVTVGGGVECFLLHGATHQASAGNKSSDLHA